MFVRSDESDGGGQWMSVSDLMAALMLIFMFIAIMYLRTVVTEEAAYGEECKKIYLMLKDKFEESFKGWDAELRDDLTIRFRNPNVLFESGSDQIRHQFRNKLKDFIPRYIDSMWDSEYRDDIREIRIEGHTSSEWITKTSQNDAYLKNMDLSQKRAQAILIFILSLPQFDPDISWANKSTWAEKLRWVKKMTTANGLSSSHLILDDNGVEDPDRSRRVEFRLMTASCRKAGVYDDSRN